MANKAFLFVGSLNRAVGPPDMVSGEGISVFEFDEESGEATHRNTFRGIDNPTFLAVDAQRRLLFAVSEVQGWNEGTLTAFRYDAADGALRYLNKQPTLGSMTNHTSIDRSGNFVFAVNYAHERRWGGFFGEEVPGHAIAVFPVDERGWLGAPTCSLKHQGSGPNRERQNEPHPHCAIASPDNRFLLVTDLGIDEVISYRFEGGKLTRHGAFAMPPGSGPRHLKFAADGRSIYVINELTSTVALLAYDPESGELALRQVISTLPEGFTGWNNCSELKISPDGLFLYGANRGHDSVAIFRIDPGSGFLEAVGHAPCGGRTPRNIGLSPSAGHLLVANQDSDMVAIFRRHPAVGTLEQVGTIAIGMPMVVGTARIQG